MWPGEAGGRRGVPEASLLGGRPPPQEASGG